MTSPIRAVLVTILFITFGLGLHSQSLTPSNATILAKIAALEQEIATLKAQLSPVPMPAPSLPAAPQTIMEAAAEAAKLKHEWSTSKNSGAPGPVIVAHDVPADTQSTERKSKLTKQQLHDAAELHDLDVLKARRTMGEAQKSLRAAENSQRDVQRTYDNTCNGNERLELIRPCSDMRYSLRYEMPRLVSEIKDSIRALARLVGTDPEEAARSNAIQR